MLFTLQYCRFLLQCSSACLSARCSSVAVLCALRLGLRDGAMACVVVWAAHFRLRGTCLGRARCVRLRFSATASGCCCSRVPMRLTIRSSRRRFLASLKVSAVRAILALHCCGRRGLTLALGGKKHSAVALSALQLIGFVCSALRRISRRVVLRLQFCARSGLACVIVQWCVRVCGLLASGYPFSVRGAPGVFGFGFRQGRRSVVVLGFPCA